jgi:primosomal protein N' (replication factor Y)
MIAIVIVELALDREFDYTIPDDMPVEVGMLVEVPFGRQTKRGYVVGLKETSAFGKLKSIGKLVSDKALIQPEIMKLARWMADYYITPFEQVIKAVLPSAVRGKDARFKEVYFAVPTPKASDEAALAQLRKRAPKQAAALDVLVASGTLSMAELAKAARTTSAWFLKTKPKELTAEQGSALEIIRQSIDTLDPPVVLLFGVTGSGKTEVYLQAIQEVLEQDKGAIVLVPEIALTPQTVRRFRSRFGNDIGVLHSHLSDGERHDEWHRIADGEVRIVVGARSALFAPVKDLALIVVDEEHDGSYKQDEAPRYHARDIAVMRGHMHKCAVVLGTATPSVESYHNTLINKFACANLSCRVDDREMPMVHVVDMRNESVLQGGPSVFSGDLRTAIQDRLDRQEQVMLLLNRRGYATSLICPKCGHVEECHHCSVSMTYHRKRNELACHICGDLRKVPNCCPNSACRTPHFKFSGLGTEKIEGMLHGMFPRAVIRRMDSDTMTRKGSYEKVLGEFRTGKIDILVGTQMIAKGLHFPNVTLVGVIYADTTLHMPDFRAGERTFQLITQVSGRAGRGDIAGEVIIQTYTPSHPSIQSARTLDYDGFFDEELAFRKSLHYPPFSRLVCITIRGPQEALVAFTAEQFHKALEKEVDASSVMMSTAVPAPIARMKGQFRYQIMLRAPHPRRMSQPIRKALAGFTWPPKVKCTVDVDAVSLM